MNICYNIVLTEVSSNAHVVTSFDEKSRENKTADYDKENGPEVI